MYKLTCDCLNVLIVYCFSEATYKHKLVSSPKLLKLISAGNKNQTMFVFLYQCYKPP
jgi:branched-subunit amino acid transport protein AzlD